MPVAGTAGASSVTPTAPARTGAHPDVPLQASPGRVGSAGPASGNGANGATPSPAPLTVRLGSACVVPGGEQRMTVRTLPGAFVAYDNLYPDNRDGQVHGGADGRARAGADGALTVTWRVGPDTPAGPVRVDVGASAPGGSAITSAYYRLAASCR